MTAAYRCDRCGEWCSIMASDGSPQDWMSVMFDYHRSPYIARTEFGSRGKDRWDLCTTCMRDAWSELLALLNREAQ